MPEGISRAFFGSKASRLVGAITGRRRAGESDDPTRDYAVRTDWSRSRGKLNYSSFVYLDVNRDGRYSLGDRPMSGVNVRLVHDGRVIAAARSNANGFANFKMSTRSRRVPIRRPGRYEFRVSVPDGWTATGGNAVQSKEFYLIPGSIAGLGTEDMVQPVGLAPPRIVRGHLAEGVTATITALAAERVLDRAKVSGPPDFRYPVPDAADAVTISAGGAEWRIAASPYPVDVGRIDPARGTLRPGTKTETIDFDGVNPRGLRKIPSGYAGLNWFNLNAMARDFTSGSQGYVNGNTSGDHIAYTSTGNPSDLWSDAPFDFVGVHLTAAWLASEGEVATIQSWRGDRLVANDDVVLTALTPVFYRPMLPEITRVRFSTAHYWQMVLDDLVIAR